MFFSRLKLKFDVVTTSGAQLKVNVPTSYLAKSILKTIFEFTNEFTFYSYGYCVDCVGTILYFILFSRFRAIVTV